MNVPINFEEMGDPTKQTIIFVHGAGGSSATWFMQLKGLSTDFHVVAIELNGHGKSPDRSEEDVLHSYLHDINEVVMKFSKPVLAGHSMGGALTQLYALYHPDYLRGIILVGTGAKLRVTPIVFNLLDNNFEGYVEAVGNFMFHESTPAEMVETSKHEVRKCSPQIIKRDFELCDEFNIMDKVDQIKSPALIVVGAADVMTPVKYSTYLNEKIKNSQMSVVEEAGHLVMFEKFGVFNELVANWVRNLT